MVRYSPYVRGLKAGVLFVAVLALAACLPRTDTASVSEQASDASAEHHATKTIDGKGRTGMAGQVFLKETGEPLVGGYVNIYPNTISNLLGPSEFISSPTDEEGRYRIDLPPGTYYVVARKRMSGEPTGPLAPGDFYSEHQRIVATVEEGRISLVDLPVVPMMAPMFFKREVVERKSETGIRGVLLDREGSPVMGGFAMAYTDQQMERLPDYASTLSDSQGRFTIYLPEGGSFYLAGRIHAWDMPQPGEPYGKYGGENPELVTVRTGSFVEDVRIVLTPFEGEYKPGKSRRPF